MSLLDLIRGKFASRPDAYEMTSERNGAMALALWDGNRLHTDKEAAEKVGLQSTPALGTDLLLMSEECLDTLRHDMGNNGRSGYELKQFSMKIPNPVFPGERVIFPPDGVGSYDEKENEVRFTFHGGKKVGDEVVPVVKSSVVLTREPLIVQELTRVDYKERRQLTQDTLDIVNKFVGRKNKSMVPHGVVAAALTAAVVDLASRAAALQHGAEYQPPSYGMVVGFDFQPYSRTKVGATLETSLQVTLRRSSSQTGTFFYGIEGAVRDSETNEPLLFGELRCISDIYFLRAYGK